MKYKAIIFDLDGTLLDTLMDIAHSVNYALKKHQLPEQSVKNIRSYLGYGAKVLIDRATQYHDRSSEVLKTYDAYYKKHANVLTKPYDGVIDLLETLKLQGYILALVSNKAHHLVEILEKEVFNHIFDLAMGETKGIQPKPAPDMLLMAMDALRLKANECLFVGDSDVDIQTAKNAHLDVVAVTWGFRDKAFLIEQSPSFIIDEPSELLDLLLNLDAI